MQPEEQEHWLNKIKKYGQDPWSDKPSLFAEFVLTQIPATGSLLELGSGSGQDSVWFATKGYDVTQTDAVDVGFERSRDLAGKQQAHIEQVIVDLWEPLIFPDESFNVVYAQLSLHYFTEEQTAKIFAEIKRVLKPGGVLAALFNSTTDPEYGTGEKIGADYFQVKSLRKRYFTVETAKRFADEFKIILADDSGETYKDNALGVNGLIRLIASK